MPAPVLVSFGAGDVGAWRIERVDPVIGDGLAQAERLRVDQGGGAEHLSATWSLSGVTSNERYVERSERSALTAVQQSLGRTSATRAALIPIRKSAAWWELTQDERRDIFERRSRHIAVGLEYLPAVARRLHHCRDLGEPFDFLTWFEYAPADAGAFEDLVQRLRGSEEWSFVDREVDIRLAR